MNLDCDIFFGGKNDNWVAEAIQLLKTEPDVISCSPLPGPPTADGSLKRQQGQVDDSPLRKVYFDALSTRLFFIHKPTFINKLCPIPVRIVPLPVIIRSLLRRRPIYALPEDVITDIMQKKHLKRADLLGTGEGLWSLHPPFRNAEFYAKLPELVRRIEEGDIPDEQRGDYDINDSMVNWDDAWEELKQASLIRRLLKRSV